MKRFELVFVVVSATGLAASVAAQAPSSSATPPPAAARLSEKLEQNLKAFDAKRELPRAQREQAYARLMEAQRYIWRLNRQRTQSTRLANLNLARNALQQALNMDPSLSEAYVALGELAFFTTPVDVDEALALSSIAVRLNKNSIGGHKLRARILTRKSGLRGTKLDASIAQQAISEWKEVGTLDPRNAEAWSIIAELYEKTARNADQIEALRKWMASSPPVDSGWSRQIIGGGAEDLQPENAIGKLAEALIAAKRHQEAIELLVQTLSDDPQNDEATELLRHAVETADTASVAIALTSLNQLAVSNPNDLSLLSFIAGLEVRMGNVEGGIKRLDDAYSRVVASDKPAAASLQVSIGDLYAGRDRLAEAAAAYERALQSRGFDTTRILGTQERDFATSVFEKLITVYKRANKVEEAKAVILRARKLLGKDDLFADRQLISLFRETGNRQDALTALRALRTANPEDVGLLRSEATILTEMGQVDRGVELIKQRIASARYMTPSQSNPTRTDDDFSNYIFIAQLYNEAGRGADGVAAADQAFSVAGNAQLKQIARLTLASAQQSAGKYADAEATLRDILKQSPDNPYALNNLGYFLLQRGERLAEALDMIERAVKVDPTNPSYLDSLGWAYFKAGRNEEALKTLQEAARIDPTSAAAHEHIGDVLQKMGKAPEARESWLKARQFVSADGDAARLKGKLESLK